MATNFPTQLAPGTWDALNRILTYIREVEAGSANCLRQLRANPDQHQQIRQNAILNRNRLLDLTRERATPFGRAFSVAIKEEGKSMAELLDMYTNRLRNDPARMSQMVSPLDRFRSAVRAVGRSTDVEQGTDWTRARLEYLRDFLRTASLNISSTLSEDIIRAAGRTSPFVNKLAYAAAGLGVAMGFCAGTLALVSFVDSEAISRQVLDTLSIANYRQFMLSAAGIGATLGSGYVVQKVGETYIVRHAQTRIRVGTVVLLQLSMSLFLMWIFGFLT